jgi:hypothetical protein
MAKQKEIHSSNAALIPLQGHQDFKYNAKTHLQE